jgi:hypothetical protein
MANCTYRQTARPSSPSLSFSLLLKMPIRGPRSARV